MWDTGNYVYTVQVFDQLELSPGSGTGTYTTKIFDTLDTQKFTYLNLSTIYPEDGVIVATNADDAQPTIEIRSSNTKPLDYIKYRKFIPYEGGESGNAPLKYKEYSIYDNSVLFTSPKLTNQNWHQNWAIYWNGDSRGRFYIDRTNKKSAAMFWFYGSSGSTVELVRIKANGGVERRKSNFISGTFLVSIYIYSLLMDAAEGIWFYVYYSGSRGWFDQSNSYYLAYFDSNMTEKFKLVDNSAFMYDMDVVRSNGNLWYTNQETKRLVQLNNAGDILSEFTFEEDLKGVAAKDDGGCWVIRGSVISNINSSSEVVSTIDLTDTVSLLTRVAVDGDDALWIIDDNTLMRIFLNGAVDFSVDLTFQGTELQTYDTGVAVFCVDRSWHFISRDNKRIIKTVTNTNSKNMYIGIEGIEYNNTIYANEFPIPFDTYWNNVEWNTVHVNDYVLPEDKYNQIRLTLRANEALTSPVVKGLYLNESIKIQDVYPKNHKTMYIKADISSHDEFEDNHYDSNLKVWWYIPT